MRIKILALGLVCLFFMYCSMLEIGTQEKRQEYVDLNTWISPEIRETILSGDVILGMIPQQVIASRGKPRKINRTTGKWGIHEQWVYVSANGGGVKATLSKKEWYQAREYAYIYFENGKVTSWQSY